MRRTRESTGMSEIPASKPPTVGLAILSRHYRQALALALMSPKLTVSDLGEGPVERILERLLHLMPEVALVDLSPSDTAALIRGAYRASPTIRTIALNQGGDENAAVSLFEAGLTAYLHRSCSVEDIRLAIRDALVGEAHCPPGITAALVRRLNQIGERKGARGGATHVSPKEAQVLPLLELGLTNKEIAQRMCVEESTIKNHVHNILRKFGVHQRGEAVRRWNEEPPSAEPRRLGNDR